jgi:peptide/nickel transport system substrate-binding protein
MRSVRKSAQALATVAIASAAWLAGIGLADAQRAKDTLRIAFNDSIQGVSYYQDPKVETVFTSAAVFDGLIAFDEERGTFEPLLAKSWRRIDPVTLEFDLRDDVKWHDGAPFTADDVVYTFTWLTDPRTRLRFKHFWSFIKSAEKLGPHRVRLIMNQPTPYDLAQLAYQTAIKPAHAHGKATDKVVWGQKPIGTGMYRVARFDQKSGLLLERNPDYTHGGRAKPPSNIGRIHIRAVPDIGTRVAELMAGQTDMLSGQTPLDQIEALASLPQFDLTAATGIGMIYFAIDAKGRAGNKALTDIRVRRAMMMAINQPEVARLVTGGRAGIENPGAMCWRFQAGCDYSLKPPAFDLSQARKLLADAGYPDGFTTNITSFANVNFITMADAVAGQLRRVGIRAEIDSMPLGAYRQKQAQGRIQLFVSGWPSGGMPDVSQTLAFLFAPPDATD